MVGEVGFLVPSRWSRGHPSTVRRGREPLAPDLGASEPAARASTHNERLPPHARVAALRRIDNERGRDNGPWFAQVLARSAGDRLDVALVERVGGDCETLAQVIEQIDEGLAARGRARGTKFRRS